MAETPWLTDAEQRAWRAFLLASTLLFDRLDRELLQQAGIPHAYYSVLAILSEQPARAMRMARLAAILGFSRSRLSHAVSRLVERGWIERGSCATDRRGTLAVLTDAGFAALAELAPGHVAGVRRHLIDRLSPEQIEQLRVIGEAVVTPLTATLHVDGPSEAADPIDGATTV